MGEKMRLYHTGFHELRTPDITVGRKNADFGRSFYLSADDAFAGKWARASRGRQVYVNAYELDLAGLTVLRFERDEAWFDYIFQNRRAMPDAHPEADVIIGPIANDTIYDTLGLLTSGLLDASLSLRLLQLGPCFEQITIKSDRALRQLTWLGARMLSREELGGFGTVLRRETEEYQRAIAAELEKENERSGKESYL